MLRSRREPRPVPVRKYRYSKWRWRILVHLLDAVGTVLAALWRVARPVKPLEAPGKILVVQLDHLGDAVLSSPIFPRLRAAFPSARIEVLASASNRAFFEADPLIDAVHLARRNWFERRPGGWALVSAVWRLGRMLRASRFDLGIDVRGDVLSVLVMVLAGIPRRVGWSMGGGGFLLTDVAAWHPSRHEVDARLALLEAIGVRDDGPVRVTAAIRDHDRGAVAALLRDAWPRHQHARPLLPLERRVLAGPGRRGMPRFRSTRPNSAPHDGEWLHAGRFGDEAPLLAVHLGAGTAAKRWPLAHWRALVARFLDDGWRVIVVGGPEDAEAGLSLPPHESLRDWTGLLEVTETAALLERAELFIGSDSGPAHLASCVGTPSVVLFSGTNRPAQWRPWSRRTLVMRRRVPCQPCHHKVCPLADHPCLSGLDPERVYRAARRWWLRNTYARPAHAAR
jgi:ADP-heptose:LPS heptosyltransferase